MNNISDSCGCNSTWASYTAHGMQNQSPSIFRSGWVGTEKFYLTLELKSLNIDIGTWCTYDQTVHCNINAIDEIPVSKASDWPNVWKCHTLNDRLMAYRNRFGQVTPMWNDAWLDMYCVPKINRLLAQDCQVHTGFILGSSYLKTN